MGFDHSFMAVEMKTQKSRSVRLDVSGKLMRMTNRFWELVSRCDEARCSKAANEMSMESRHWGSQKVKGAKARISSYEYLDSSSSFKVGRCEVMEAQLPAQRRLGGQITAGTYLPVRPW